MEQDASRRFRFRLTEADAERLTWLLEHTRFRTKSAAAKNAVKMHAAALNAQAQGFALWFQDSQTGERESYTETAAPPVETRARRADGFLEIRLAPHETQELSMLMGLCHAENASAAVRRALRFTVHTEQKSCEGLHLVAVSRSGESFRLFASDQSPMGKHDAENTRNEAPLESALAAMLPRSLWEELKTLAEREQCPPEHLVVDLLRQSIAARRRTFEPGPSVQFAASERAEAKPRQDGEERRHGPDHVEPPRATTEALPATLVPPSVQEGWALVVTQDYDGAPTGQLVTPDMVIPLDEEDFGEVS